MAMYKISLLGLYTYDNTLFDQLYIPPIFPAVPGDTPFHYYTPNKDTLVNLILEKAADFPALYPNVDFMKFMCGVWSKNCEYMMCTLWETMNAKFNPIENYDRIEDWTDSLNSNSAINSSVTANGNTQHDVAGFNSSTLVNASKDTNTETDTGYTSDTSTSSGWRKGRVHGNIGVTTSQKMLESELDVAPKLNVYDYIINSFKNRFCLQVY